MTRDVGREIRNSMGVARQIARDMEREKGSMTNQQAPRALRPCPHCGAKPTWNFIPAHEHHMLMPNPDTGRMEKMPPAGDNCCVECACGAGMIDASAVAVVERWNRRAESATPAPETPRTTDEAVAYLTIENGCGHLSFANEHPELADDRNSEPLYGAPRTMAAQPAAQPINPLWTKGHAAAGFDAAPVAQADAQDAARDVLAERQRQMSVEGWTPKHDDEHGDKSIAGVAKCYVDQYVGRAWLVDGGMAERYITDPVPDSWPGSWHESAWKPKNPRRDLVRAAALILAEIERIDRAAIAAQADGGDK